MSDDSQRLYVTIREPSKVYRLTGSSRVPRHSVCRRLRGRRLVRL